MLSSLRITHGLFLRDHYVSVFQYHQRFNLGSAMGGNQRFYWDDYLSTDVPIYPTILPLTSLLELVLFALRFASSIIASLAYPCRLSSMFGAATISINSIDAVVRTARGGTLFLLLVTAGPNFPTAGYGTATRMKISGFHAHFYSVLGFV